MNDPLGKVLSDISAKGHAQRSRSVEEMRLRSRQQPVSGLGPSSDVAMKAQLLGLRSFDPARETGVTDIVEIRRNQTDAVPSLVMLDISEGPAISARYFVAGDMQAQAAIKIEAFTHRVKLPRTWGEKADTATEAIISLATGRGPQNMLTRFTTVVSESLEVGPTRPLLELYRYADLIPQYIHEFIRSHNKPRAIAWRSRNNPRLWTAQRLAPNRIETREDAIVYVWDNEDF